MTPFVAIKELLYEENRPRTTKTGLARVRKACRALSLSEEETAHMLRHFLYTNSRDELFLHLRESP